MRKAALDMVHALAQRDARVVYIGSDPTAGTLAEMAAECPDRFFIEGIAEANLIGMAAGLAMDGFMPFVHTIATFLTRRCYEQIAVDVCLHDLPVRLIANGGGLVYAPLGPTHCAIEDMAILSALPNMTVIAPADAVEMKAVMEATLDWPHPIYVRFGKGGDPVITTEGEGFAIGKAILKRDGGDVLILSTGVMTHRALQAAEALNCSVLHVPTVKPFDSEALLRHARGKRLVVAVEEHVKAGGLGAAMLDALAEGGLMVPTLRLALPDSFIHNYGSQEGLLARFGLDPAGIEAAIRAQL